MCTQSNQFCSCVNPKQILNIPPPSPFLLFLPIDLCYNDNKWRKFAEVSHEIQKYQK